QSLHKTELTARLRRHRKIPVSKTGNHIHTILQQARKGGDWMSPPLSLIADVAGKAPSLKLPISPRAGEMAGRPEVGAVPPHFQLIGSSGAPNK
ncbi:hypothetical protein NKK51_23250, partial [Mesorhizobium sp. M0011]